MSIIPGNEPLAAAVVDAIHTGDLESLERLLAENPGLATARIRLPRDCDGAHGARTLLHIATDWPGHYPNGAATVAALVAAGAEINAHAGRTGETPLHWAASSDDVEALDALLDRGADIDVEGAVIGGGTPLADAVAFGQWNAARRLIERGAKANLWQAAALGLAACVEEHFGGDAAPTSDEITNAFWCACHGGQRETAEYLLRRGADINWIGYDDLTALDTAHRSGTDELVAWLRTQGAKSTKDLR